MNITTRAPLLRTPLSLIIDDSCPALNVGYWWLRERAEWYERHPEAEKGRGAWEANLSIYHEFPRTIPLQFYQEWLAWCASEGVRGKFSMIPCPLGKGRIDQRIEGVPDSELQAWLESTRAQARSFAAHCHETDRQREI